MRRFLVCVTILWVTALIPTAPAAAGLPSSAIQVQNQHDYERLKQAVSAGQVVLTDLGRSPNYRVIGVLAAVVEAAAKNPEITLEQLSSFASELDSFLSNPTEPTLSTNGDSKLLTPINFITAVRFGVRAARQPGMRADFGLEVLQILGLKREQRRDQKSQLVEFLSDQAFDPINSHETAMLFAFAMLGLDSAGNPNPIVRSAAISYLRSQGFEPFPTPAIMSFLYPGVAEAMAELPADYESFNAARASGFEEAMDGLFAQTGAMMDKMRQTIDRMISIDTRQRTNYIDAFLNPNSAYIQAAKAQRQLDVEYMNQARAALNIPASVMALTNPPTDADHVCKTLAAVKSTTDALSKVVAAMEIWDFKPSNIIAGISGFSDLLGMGAGILNSPESTDDRILSQVVQMRQQIDYMQLQLNTRFDAIDTSLDRILMQLGDINLKLSSIRTDIYEMASDMNRLNQNLFGALQEAYQQDYLTAVDRAFEFKARTGFDLPFLGAGSFDEFENIIRGQAVTGAMSATFAGPSSGTSQLTLVNAPAQLDRADFGYNINDLRRFPADSSPSFWASPLYPTRVANPTVWSTSANAYAEFARENSWYFSIERQNLPSRLDDIITIGQNAQDALQCFGNRQMLSNLRNYYLNTLLPQLLQVAGNEHDALLRSTIFPYTGDGIQRDAAKLNIWGAPNQSVSSWHPLWLNVKAYPNTGISDPAAPLKVSDWLPAEFVNWRIAIPGSSIHIYMYPDIVDRWTTFGIVPPFVWWYNLYGKPYALILFKDAPDSGNFLMLTATGDDMYIGTEYYMIDPMDWEVWNRYRYVVPNNWTDGQNLRSRLKKHAWAGDSLIPGIRAALETKMTGCQSQFYSRMVTQLQPTGTGPVADVARKFSSIQSLLEAYISLGFPESIGTNEILRGALRGNDFQLDRQAVCDIYANALDTLPPSGGISAGVVQAVQSRFSALDRVLDSVVPADSTRSPEVHPCIKYALANLTELKPGRMHLANDDQYSTPPGTVLAVSSSNGVLANDAPRPNVPPEQVGYTVEAIFVPPGAPYAQRATSQGGNVVLNSDGKGGFQYTPPVGFEGMDSFQYVACGNVAGTTSNPLYSNPATVYVTVQPPGVITAQPQDVMVASGQRAVLQVGVKGDCSVRWRKNGVVLGNTGQITGAETNCLVISPAALEDGGDYDVVVSRPGYPDLASDSATLTIVAGSVGDSRLAPDGAAAEIMDVVVSRAWPDFFYVQTAERMHGIRVARTGHSLQANRHVAVSGVVRTDDNGERYIDATWALPVGHGSAVPLGVTNRALGGGDCRHDWSGGIGQCGVTGGAGANNIGLLVRVWGVCTYVDAHTFTIDDGSGPVKCVLPTGVYLPQSWHYVCVTGISSCEKVGEEIHRLIRVQSLSDIVPQSFVVSDW